MEKESPLTDWYFLLGKWKGTSEGQYNTVGKISSTIEFTLELNGKCIMAKHEAWTGKQFVNSSIGLLFYDQIENRFLRKVLYSYGFVNNDVEYTRNPTEIRFETTTEPLPRQFQGIHWHSYIKKNSETEIVLGMETSKNGKDFKLYGETVFQKVN
ncbi:MAG: hypothetical protein ACFFDP_05325 [Promethearchaeota archaeon]